VIWQQQMLFQQAKAAAGLPNGSYKECRWWNPQAG